MSKNEYLIQENDLLALIHWARRYCDCRRTFSPSEFNKLYKRIIAKYPELPDVPDNTLKYGGRYFPYAQDGMYDEETGAYDARK